MRLVIIFFWLLCVAFDIELHANRLTTSLADLRLALSSLENVLQEPAQDKKFDPSKHIDIATKALKDVFDKAQNEIKNMFNSFNKTEELIIKFLEFVENNKHVVSVKEIPKEAEDLAMHIKNAFSKPKLQAFINAANGLVVIMRGGEVDPGKQAIQEYLDEAIQYFDNFWSSLLQYKDQASVREPSFPFNGYTRNPFTFFANDVYRKIPVTGPKQYREEGWSWTDPAELNLILRDTKNLKKWLSKA